MKIQCSTERPQSITLSHILPILPNTNTYFFFPSLLPAQQAEHFCNSIGILQQGSVPSKFPGFERTGSQTPQQTQQEDYAQLFSTLISRCAKDIDTLIESLPSEESSIELQVQALKRLEVENQDSAEKLEEVVRKGELLLEKIQAALSDIAQSQLDMQYSSSPKKQ